MDDETTRQSSDLWRDILVGTQPRLRTGRGLLKRLPGDVRCKLCGAPFEGPVSPLMRLAGKGRWPKNPKFCRSCFTYLVDNRGGAEIDCSLIFADVRGSTGIGETMRPSDVRDLMDRFFRTAAMVLVEHDAIVDRFVGDQAIGIFVPALAGEHHAARAIGAAQALLAATGHGSNTPWIPVGIGVHTGVAFVGCVGSEALVDFTALGDTVNIAARLASSGSVGETLVTLEAAASARLDTGAFERRELALKGKHEPTSVLVIPADRSARPLSPDR